MKTPSCIHAFDVVELTTPVRGWDAEDRELDVPAGTRGTVVVDVFGAAFVEVEVVDHHTGAPAAFFEADRTHLRLVSKHRQGVAR